MTRLTRISFSLAVAAASLATAVAVAVPGALGVSGTDTIVTVVGNGTAGHTGDGGQATLASIDEPAAVAVGPDGDLYIADFDDNTVRKLSNGVLTTVAGTGERGFSGDGGPAVQAQLAAPGGVAVDAQGTLYISDTRNQRIREVKDGTISTIAGNGKAGFNGDDIAATSAEFIGPLGLAVDADDNLYVADTGNNRVRKITGGTITTVAGDGIDAFGGDGGPATSAQLGGPYDVAVDAEGNLYIADEHDGRIRKVSGGVITTVAAASDSEPSGVAVDPQGNLYIADFIRNVVRKLSGGELTTVAGTGTAGFSGDGGQATSARLGGPSDVAVDRRGDVFVADNHNHRIREIVNKPPTASFTASPAGGAALTVAFDASASSDPDGQVAKVVWDFGDGATAGAPKTSHTYTRAGSYRVELTVTDDGGAMAGMTRTLTVKAPTLAASGFAVGRAQAGKPFTVAFTVKRAGKGVAGSLSCGARLNGNALGASHRSTSSNGRASCTWNLPRSSRGGRLTGSISETSRGAKVSRSFSVRVA